MAMAPADFGYWFDEAVADAAAEFFPRYLRLTTGEWAGRPFELEPWQADFIRQLFGWKRADGTRRYRRGRLWVPRKNGKTEFAAGIGILATVADGEPGAQTFSIAEDKAQASIVFDKASAMAMMSPDLAEHLELLSTSIYCPALMSSMKPLSGVPKGKHGLNAHCILGDEAHEWTSDRLYTFVRQSMGARRQPLDIIISTAGERKGFGWELFQECEKIRDGVIDDPETLVVIYGAEPDDDWTDPKVWAKANPNLGISIKESYLADECKQAKENPRKENDFRRYHLNQWVEQSVRWITKDAWNACTEAPTDPDLWRELAERMRGRTCWGGLDLASTRDVTAFVLVFPPEGAEERFTVLCRFYVPAETLDVRVRRDRIPYDLWAASGALVATDGHAGRTTDYNAVFLDVQEAARTYDVQAIAYDRWNSSDLVNRLRDDGAPMQEMGQGFGSLASPTKEFERLVFAHGLEHGNQPVLRWMASNVAVSQDAAGNIKPAKDRSSEKIDGIVATIMALGKWMAEKPEETTVSRGFVEF
jgi:phage terminase large subunit-like protein